MMFRQPVEHIMTKLLHKFHKLGGVFLSRNPGHFILSRIPLYPTSLKIVCIILPINAKNQRKGRNRAVVLQRLLGSITRSMQEYRAELERCIVSNSETPVGRYLS